MTDRSVLVVVHTGRRGAVAAAGTLIERLVELGLSARVLATEAPSLHCPAATVIEPDGAKGAVSDRLELVVALGGDGTMLRAAELARPVQVPLLGINLGHVGFLAEFDRSDLDTTAERIWHRTYDVQERLTLDMSIVRDHHVVARGWALNDVTVEKASRQRMLELVVEVDGRPLSRWDGDGVVCATPTGSTAYAFSAGGPVVWPSVQAMLVVPISAHALFARPLVISPDSRVAVELLPGRGGGVVFCDGRRTLDIDPRDRVEVVRGEQPVRLVRLRGAAFTDRLVTKFRLPVGGWRGPTDDD